MSDADVERAKVLANTIVELRHRLIEKEVEVRELVKRGVTVQL